MGGVAVRGSEKRSSSRGADVGWAIGEEGEGVDKDGSFSSGEDWEGEKRNMPSNSETGKSPSFEDIANRESEKTG